MKGLQITCEDCMELMERYPDKYFDLAIIDPPYGIGMDGNNSSTGKHGGRKAHAKKNWDKNIPNKSYFSALIRVSRHQIIWGANYYPQFLSSSMGWIFWDKGQDLKQSDGELAYTSFNKALKRKKINRVELLLEGTIHPTQKPIKLYKWLLTNYAKPGNKILDTHMGSGSIAIACYDMGFDLTACELDPDYYRDAMERIRKHTEQQALFTPQEMYHA